MEKRTEIAPVYSTSFPRSGAEISEEWLLNVLKDAGVKDAGRLETIELLPVTEGFGVTSSYARIRLGYSSPSEGSLTSRPETVFVKWSSGTDVSMLLSRREVRFFTDFASHIRLRIPHCYFAAFDEAEEQAMLVFEDVSSARTGDSLLGCSVEQAELVLGQIAILHAEWWEHPMLRHHGWIDRANEETIRWADEVFNSAWLRFRERFPDLLSDWAVDLAVKALGRVRELFGLLSEGPLTLVHGDLQLDNIRFGVPDAPFVLLDWQLTMRAPAAWDIHWFLAHALPVDQRRAQEEHLILHYHESLLAAGVSKYPLDLLRRQLVTGVILTFLNIIMASVDTNFAGDRGDKLRHAFIERHIAMLEDYRAWEVFT